MGKGGGKGQVELAGTSAALSDQICVLATCLDLVLLVGSPLAVAGVWWHSLVINVSLMCVCVCVCVCVCATVHIVCVCVCVCKWKKVRF